MENSIRTIRRRDLYKSPVVFDERSHVYYIRETGQELSGVTSLIGRMLFPNKYDGIDPETLQRKARRGTEIHRIVQDLLMGRSREGEDAYPEVARFAGEIELPYAIIDDEYLVSDEANVATMIDLVDTAGNLYDIKTTSVLDRDYLSWQLSIGAYLFDRQNEAQGIRAQRLFGIWLTPERAELIEIPRKPTEEIEALIRAFTTGEVFIPAVQQSEEIAHIVDYEEQIIRFKQFVKEAEALQAKAMANLKKEMERTGTKKIETERVLITLVADSTSKTFDAARFKADHPELSEQYQKETKRKGYVKITLRDLSDTAHTA